MQYFVYLTGISGSGQQHGSVWWKKNAIDTLKQMNNDMDIEKHLVNTFSSSFSKDLSPIWMDSSTKEECDEIMKSNN